MSDKDFISDKLGAGNRLHLSVSTFPSYRNPRL